MREIIFRGKRKDNGKWIEGYFFETNTPVYRAFIITNMSVDVSDNCTDILDFNIIEVIPETVGQFTGLTDKNGKKIWEGDIIDTPDRLIEVVWFERNAQFDLKFIKHAHDKKIINFKGIEMRDLKEYEVIDNIHDNPEILKGGADNG